jgi:hypothetical protein
MKNIIITILAAAALLACSEEQVPLYGNEHYIQFVKDIHTDSTVITFFIAPGKDALDSTFIVKTTGTFLPAETPYKITVDEERTTAVRGIHYNLLGRTAIRAGSMRDTATVTFLRVPDMQTRSYRLVLRLEANDYFTPGEPLYRYKVFIIQDMISEPAWWPAFVNSYLGPYSDGKYKALIAATGEWDFAGVETSEFRARALQLKYYLEKHKLDHGGEPLRDENNAEITIPING